LAEAAQVVSRRETRAAKPDKSAGATGSKSTRLQTRVLPAVVWQPPQIAVLQGAAPPPG
jgi:hypothetical protein